MEPREQRGLIIAARHRIKPKGNRWLVPSQTDSGKNILYAQMTVIVLAPAQTLKTR